MVSNLAAACVISGKAYITVSGIQFKYADDFLDMRHATNCVITNCLFGPGRSMGNWSGSVIKSYSSSNVVSRCTFFRWGSYSGSASGAVFEIGTEDVASDGADYTHHNRIENCTMHSGGHHVIGLFGQYDIVRGNYFHNDAWLSGYGYRVVYVDSTVANGGWNLIESNCIAYAAQTYTLDLTSCGLDIICANNIVRRNQFYYNDGPGLSFTSAGNNYICDVVFNYAYNNSFLANGLNAGYGQVDQSMIAFGNYSTIWQMRSNYIKNNVYQTYIQTNGYYPNAQAATMRAAQVFSNNWPATTRGLPLFVSTNRASPNLTLQAASPCIDAGGYLTTITSASGNGSTFTVADSHYFCSGWGITTGDVIQLQGQPVSATITAIDYGTGAITVNRNLTWTNGQGVALAYSGSAPDIGAFEYSGVLQTPPSPPTDLRIIGVGN